MCNPNSDPSSYSETCVRTLLSHLAVALDSLHRSQYMEYVDASHFAHELVSKGMEGLEGEDRLAYSNLQKHFFAQRAELEKSRSTRR